MFVRKLKANKMNSNYLTPKQAAEYTGYTIGTIYKLTHRKEVHFTKPRGGKVYISKKSLDTFMGWDED